MSTNNYPCGDISSRLAMLIETFTPGNNKKFAEETGIVYATLHNYLKGRSPSVDAVTNICRTYNVNPSWLLWGEEPCIKQPNKEGGSQLKRAILAELSEWLDDICEDEPERESWFKMQLIDLLPLFNEWLKKRDQANAKISNRRAA